MSMKTNDKANWLGIDVGGTTVKLALFRTGGETSLELIRRTVIPTRTEDSGVNILPDIADAIKKLADEADVPLDQIRGAGMGVPGPVLSKTEQGFPVVGCVNLGWRGKIYYPDAELQSLTGIENIYVCNDANAAALGELYFGSEVDGADADMDTGSGAGSDAGSGSTARAVSSAVMITLGTGIGGGIISGGEIVTGAFGAAGEVGHMPVRPDTDFLQMIHEKDPSVPMCSDLEHYASASGIARITRAALKAFDTESVLRDVAEPQAKDLFDAAKAGDPLAERITGFFFDTLGQGLASIASVVDPELFIIGGGVAAAGNYLLDGIREAYRRQVFHASRETDFRLASLGNDAGLLGPLAPLLR